MGANVFERFGQSAKSFEPYRAYGASPAWLGAGATGWRSEAAQWLLSGGPGMHMRIGSPSPATAAAGFPDQRFHTREGQAADSQRGARGGRRRILDARGVERCAPAPVGVPPQLELRAFTRPGRSEAHSIFCSARKSSDGGIVRPRALAVLRLMYNANVVGC